jgi:lysine 6-dehydrogenase
LKDRDGTVFVLGGGRIGLTAVRDLVRSGPVERVLVGDIEASRAEKLAAELGSDKLGVTKVDLTKHRDLVAAIKDSRVLINAAWYENNVDVMKAAIEAGVHYLDMGGLFHVTRRQMELDNSARKAGVTAVLGAGESPGITNVMCASSGQELDTVEDIRIRVGAREKETSKSDKLVFPFAVSTVFDEYSKPPIMFLNGKFQQVEPLSGEEEVQFADPVGKQACHYSIHSEIATLPMNIKGVRNVDFKLGISETIYRAIKSLVDAGMAAAEPIEIRGQKISPREFAIALLTAAASDAEPSRYVALKTEVTGTKQGKKICQFRELIGEPSENLGVKNATALLTGIGASITAQLIITGEIRGTGVMAPESCIPAAKLTNELAKRGIVITKREIAL